MSEYHGLTLCELGVADWDRIDIEPDDSLILFTKNIYAPEEDCPGFKFCCVDFNARFHAFDPPVTKFDVVFEGRAYFDGVRHLHFGREETQNYGYLHYQNVPSLIEALQALDRLCHEKGCDRD